MIRPSPRRWAPRKEGIHYSRQRLDPLICIASFTTPLPLLIKVKEQMSHLSLQLPRGTQPGHSVKLQSLVAAYFQVPISCSRVSLSMCHAAR